MVNPLVNHGLSIEFDRDPDTPKYVVLSNEISLFRGIITYSRAYLLLEGRRNYNLLRPDYIKSIKRLPI